MSEQTNNPLETPLSFTRNGVTVTMNIFEGKKGKWEGVKFQAPQLTTNGTDCDIAEDTDLLGGLRMLGKDNIVNAFNTILKRYGQDFVVDATDEVSKEFDVNKYIGFWVNLTSAALSKSELEELQQQLADELTKASTDMLANMAQLASDPVLFNKTKENVERISRQLATVKQSLEERKKRRSKEENTETVMAAA